jgi:hypothetical protein
VAALAVADVEELVVTEALVVAVLLVIVAMVEQVDITIFLLPLRQQAAVAVVVAEPVTVGM